MKKFLILLVIVVCIIAGVAYWRMSAAPDASMAQGGGAPRPQAVSVIDIKQSTIQLTSELPGRITAFRQSQVRPQVDGIVVERLFDEGTTVEKGQQLYQIDDARYTAALNSALADLKSAEASMKSVESRAQRYERLVKIKAISQQEYDDVQAEYDQAKASVGVAQAAVDVAQVNLDYTKVYAPIAGVISRSFVTEGALVTANQSQQLATITQLDPIYVDMQQSGTEAMKLRSRMAGMDSAPVEIMLNEAAKTKYQHEGTLQFSEVTVDETTGSIALRARVPNPDHVLLPGLFVRAQVNLGEVEALLVPQRATSRMPDGTLKVWVVADGNTAQQKTIQVDQAYADQWIVTSGLNAGDKVIIEGYQKVRDGAPVAPSPWQENNTQEKAN